MAKNPILKGARLVYRGSVKNVYELKPPTPKRAGVAVFEFTDDYSVFDYGKMPDKIDGKGQSLALMTASIFEQIENPKTWRELYEVALWDAFDDSQFKEEIKNSKALKRLKREGLRTHYLGMVSEDGKLKALKDLKKFTNLVAIKSVNVVHPKKVRVANAYGWNYSGLLQYQCRLIPLECIFRFGAPKGSSFFERSKNKDYLKALGLSDEPTEGSWFSRPIVEFSTKLEPADRVVDYEFALNISGLGDRFVEIYELTILGALWLKYRFAKANIELWDGKFEFALIGNELVLVDAITPDELRLTFEGVQMSKEPIRQYYKVHQPDFVSAMKEAKKLSTTDSRALKDIVADLGHPPVSLNAHFKETVSYMYRALAYQVAASSEAFTCEQFDFQSIADTFRKFGVA